MMSISTISKSGVDSRMLIASRPVPAVSTVIPLRSRTLLNAKMLRTSSSTMSTFLPTSASSDRCSRSSIRCFSGGRSATTRCRNSAVSSSKRSGDSTPFTTTLRASTPARCCARISGSRTPRSRGSARPERSAIRAEGRGRRRPPLRLSATDGRWYMTRPPRPPAGGSSGIRADLAAQRGHLWAAAVHAVQRPDPDLQHDGHPQLRPRQLLHAGRVLRVPDQHEDRILARSADRAGPGGDRGRADRAVRHPQGAPVRPRRRAALHLRSRLPRHRGGAARLGKGRGRLSRPGLALRHLVHALLLVVPRLQGLHDGGVGRDAADALRAPDLPAHRPDRAGRAVATRHGAGARPRRAPHLHSRLRRRIGAGRHRWSDRRERLRHRARHGRRARADRLRGGGGGRARLARRRVHRLAADRNPADVHGRHRLFAGGLRAIARDPDSLGPGPRAALPDPAGGDHAVRADGRDPDLPPARPHGGARDMKPPPLLTASRLLSWAAYLALILVAPLLSRSGYWLSLLSQIAIMTVFALSFNMLLGQTGLLSFGHAVYYGLGAMITMHALIAVNHHVLPIPVTLLPLIGGLGGLFFGVLLGYVTTRRAGTTFAMISLGIGEMVAASSLMVPAFSGGEGGLSVNRA